MRWMDEQSTIRGNLLGGMEEPGVLVFQSFLAGKMRSRQNENPENVLIQTSAVFTALSVEI